MPDGHLDDATLVLTGTTAATPAQVCLSLGCVPDGTAGASATLTDTLCLGGTLSGTTCVSGTAPTLGAAAGISSPPLAHSVFTPVNRLDVRKDFLVTVAATATTTPAAASPTASTVAATATSTPVIPELPSLALFGSGLLLLGVWADSSRRRR